MGAMVGVFQDGFAADLLGVSQIAPIVGLIPILTIGILFDLAMDYQVFLVSGMKEAHAHRAATTRARHRRHCASTRDAAHRHAGAAAGLT